jgi:hypothetical protein
MNLNLSYTDYLNNPFNNIHEEITEIKYQLNHL